MAKKMLEELTHDQVMQLVLDPENANISEQQQQHFKRVLSAAQMLDDHPDDAQVFKLLMAKYGISIAQARRDTKLAKEVFKSRHTFDWDFWHLWEIKDQIKLVQRCRDANDYKNWNAAKKVLHDLIGERPVEVTDPRRMEKNVFYIQVNNGTGQKLNISIDQLRSLSEADRRLILDTMTQPIEDADVEEIFES